MLDDIKTGARELQAILKTLGKVANPGTAGIEGQTRGEQAFEPIAKYLAFHHRVRGFVDLLNADQLSSCPNLFAYAQLRVDDVARIGFPPTAHLYEELTSLIRR